MDFQFDTMTENSLASLAAAGCILDISISGWGEAARFRGKISKGSAQHGGAGFCLVIEGEGEDGAAALRGAVATAETFLSMVPPRRPAPVLPEIPAPPKPPLLDSAVAPDTLRTANRIANAPAAAHDDALARELVDADQGLGR